MIRRIEALNFRCLKYISQSLNDFQVLIGPNASGKTTFLDVVSIIGDIVSDDLETTIATRTTNFHDLIWRRKGKKFELAIELEIPDVLRAKLEKKDFDVVRYEVAIGCDDNTDEISILSEKVVLIESELDTEPNQIEVFPAEHTPPSTIILKTGMKNTKTIINKVKSGNDNFYDETGKGWDHAFRLGPRRSALGNLPEDESKFPVATWLKKNLIDGVQRLVLNSNLMRMPSPPGQPKRFRPDGSNLPWVIDNLFSKNKDQYKEWLCHVQMALPDIKEIKTVIRDEDRNRYLVIIYDNGVEVPSWTVSDGTLRFLALTLPAYLNDIEGIYLIEEPENGIHPKAIEAMFQSLSSVYNAQIIMASHSPVILSVAETHQILCFSKTQTGAVDIVNGKDHPALRDWKGETNLSVLFAGGVLG